MEHSGPRCRQPRIRTLLILVAGVAGVCAFLRWALGRDDLTRGGIIVLGIAVGFWVACVEGYVLLSRALFRLLGPGRRDEFDRRGPGGGAG